MTTDEFMTRCMEFGDSCPYPVAGFVGDDHRLVYANPTFCDVAGGDLSTLHGKAVVECLPQCPGCVDLLTRVRTTEVPESHAEGTDAEFWSYSAWPVFPGGKKGLTLLQVTEMSKLHQRSTSVNEALLVSVIAQHVLAEEAQASAAQMSSEVSQKAAELDHTKEELRGLALQLLQVQEDERQRIARELHDHFAQELASLGMQLFDLARRAMLDSEQVSAFARLQEQIGGLSTGIRTLSHELHPPALEDLGLTASLYSLVENFETTHNLAARLAIREVPESVPLSVAITIYRVTQEALWNAMKHGGPDAFVTVRLSGEHEKLLLSVEDTGSGFDQKARRGKGGLGLISMQERTRLVGGSLRIEAEPGKGTRILAELPLPAASSAEGKPRVSLHGADTRG